MGLCKCPKRKVTQHFCFEHRVNVCESCMIHDHVKCVVQPYLQWLDDSSYCSNCRFCNHPLVDEVCIRLLCYHLFHWRCFNRYAADHPPNTTPSGYTCPDCNISIFPPGGSKSPVCLQLRNLLANAEWAKEGLRQSVVAPDQSVNSNLPNGNASSDGNSSFSMHGTSGIFQDSGNCSNSIQVLKNISHLNQDDSCVPININSVSNFISDTSNNWSCSSRNAANESRLPLLLESDDVDEDKYKSKPASEFITRWFRLRMAQTRRLLPREEEGADYSRFVIPGIILALFLFTALHFLLKYGRQAADHDLSLDPAFNPNIRVEDNPHDADNAAV